MSCLLRCSLRRITSALPVPACVPAPGLACDPTAHHDRCEGAILDVEHGALLVAEGMNVEGHFLFRDLKLPAHGVDLASASVGALIDDDASWGNGLTLSEVIDGGMVLQ